MGPANLLAHRAGVDPRHFQDVLKQPPQALRFRENELTLAEPILGRQLRGQEIAGGNRDGGQRRAQVVTDRREQRGLQLFALPRQLTRLALLEQVRPLDRNRDDAGERVQRPGFDRAPCRRENPDRLRAHPQRHETDGSAFDLDRAMAGIRSRMRVEFERRLGGRKRGRQLPVVQPGGLRTGLVDVPVAAAGHRHRRK